MKQVEEVASPSETNLDEHSWTTQAAQDSQASSNATNQDNEGKDSTEGLPERQNADLKPGQQVQEQPQPRKGLIGKLFKRN